jgi:hypothetical protein
MAVIVSFVWVAAAILSPIYTPAWLLFIPGFFAYVLFGIIVPIRTIEQTGFVVTFMRSIALTSGHRWSIAGLIFALLAASTLYEVIVYGAFANTPLADVEDPGRAWILCMVAADIVFGIVSAAVAMVLYFELRRIKEGIAPEAVASEFD